MSSSVTAVNRKPVQAEQQREGGKPDAAQRASGCTDNEPACERCKGQDAERAADPWRLPGKPAGAGVIMRGVKKDLAAG